MSLNLFSRDDSVGTARSVTEAALSALIGLRYLNAEDVSLDVRVHTSLQRR